MNFYLHETPGPNAKIQILKNNLDSFDIISWILTVSN